MADSTHIQTISTRSHVVRQDLLQLIDLLSNERSTLNSQRLAAADHLDRFSLWAGSLGAMRSPLSPLSLDQRLRKATEIREEITRQLDEIIEAIVDLTNSIQHTTPRRDTLVDTLVGVFTSSEIASLIGLESDRETDDCLVDEADMLLQVVSESINSLLRLGMLVRKVAPRDGFQQALRDSDSAFPEWSDINYVKQRFDKLRNSQLSNRLGSAIAKRRQFIKYCRDRRSPLDMKDATQDATVSEKVLGTATTSEPIPDIQSGDMLEGESGGVSSTSATTIGAIALSLKLPRMNDLSRAHESFECCICFTSQCFQSEKEWQIHAFSDLKAYVCTMGGAECDTGFFGDRDAWFEHELRNHRCHYRCILCSQGDFSSQSLLDHIAEAHGSFSSAQSEMLQDAGRELPTSFKAKDCPFCDEWAETLRLETTMEGRASDTTPDVLVSHSQFKRHIAMHHEQLAIFAVPGATQEQDVSGHEPTAASHTMTTTLPSFQSSGDVAPMETFANGAVDVNDDMDIDGETKNEPLQMTSNPVIGIRDGSSTSEANIHSTVRPNERRNSRASRQEERRSRMSAARTRRRLAEGRRSAVHIYTWQCCRCGITGLLLEADIQGSEYHCQHRRCGTCHVS
ncbi:hypothetical protein V8C26DRAFT_383631 [Trichoderma gracile]